MARFKITGPDGASYQITAPDDASDADIMAFVSQQAPKMDKPQRTPQEEQAFGKVDAFRKDHPVLSGISDTASALVRGTPVGSWLDEFTAATLSALPGGKSYDEIMATQKAMEERAQEGSATVATLPVIGDVSGRGLTKVAGGLMTAPFLPYVGAGQGAAMLPRMGAAGLTGAGYGTVYGAGEGEGTERLGNAAVGGAIGGLLGLFTPPLAEGVGNAYSWARDRIAQVPQGVQNYSRAAVDRVSQPMQADNVTPAMARVDGPNGMLADASQGMTTLTEGLAQQAGPARTIISDAITTRQTQAPARITNTVNTELAPPANMPATEQATRQHYQQAAAPLYEQFYNTPIRPDQELVAILQSVPDDIWPRVQRMMRMERVDPAAVMNTGRGIDLIKRALDDGARAAGRGTNEERLYSNLSRNLRNHVDNLLSPGNPAQSPWAQGREIAGEGIGVREAMDMGQGVFSRRVDPQQLQADMQGMSQAEREGVRIGARDDLRQVMGRAATNFRQNGDATARRALNSEFSRQNLDEIAGVGPSQRIRARIDAENRMAETANQVLSNSATARRQSVRDIVPRQYEQTNAVNLRGTSLTGAALEGVSRIANILLGGALNARNQRMATDMARMLVAQGAEREQIVAGLQQYIQRQGVTAVQRRAIERVMNSLSRGSQPVTIDAVANQ